MLTGLWSVGVFYILRCFCLTATILLCFIFPFSVDYAGGRVMADTTSMFVVGLYHYYKWTGDQDTINRLWPAAKRAMAWVMVDSTKGLFCFTFRSNVFYFCFGLVLYS